MWVHFLWPFSWWNNIINPLNPGHFYEFSKFIKVPQCGYHKVKPFYSGRIVSKLMAKNTSLLTKNTTFEHKFHVDTIKWQKRQNAAAKYHFF
jgi:hypothetical protein